MKRSVLIAEQRSDHSSSRRGVAALHRRKSRGKVYARVRVRNGERERERKSQSHLYAKTRARAHE